MKTNNEEQVMKEIAILEALARHNHPFVVRFVAHMVCESLSAVDRFCDSRARMAFILMEKAQTSLLKFIDNRRVFLDRESLRSIMT